MSLRLSNLLQAHDLMAHIIPMHLCIKATKLFLVHQSCFLVYLLEVMKARLCMIKAQQDTSMKLPSMADYNVTEFGIIHFITGCSVMKYKLVLHSVTLPPPPKKKKKIEKKLKSDFPLLLPYIPVSKSALKRTLRSKFATYKRVDHYLLEQMSLGMAKNIYKHFIKTNLDLPHNIVLDYVVQLSQY